MDIKELLLTHKQALRERSRQVFAALRAEHFSWRPEKDALSVGEILRHLWVSEEGMRRIALRRVSSFLVHAGRIRGVGFVRRR